MNTFQDLLLTFTTRISHEEDFAFDRDRGPLANALRKELLQLSISEPDLELRDVAVDEDGDISVQTKKCSVFVTSDSLLMIGWVTTPEELADASFLSKVSRLVATLFEARGSFRPKTYGARWLFSTRFPPRIDSTSLTSKIYAPILASILEDVPSSVNSFQVNSNYRSGEFSDLVEIEISKRDIQIRQGRESDASNFHDFGEFLLRADLAGTIDRLRPTLSGLTSELGNMFRRIQRTKQ